jgi:hypothetical protein
MLLINPTTCPIRSVCSASVCVADDGAVPTLVPVADDGGVDRRHRSRWSHEHRQYPSKVKWFGGTEHELMDITDVRVVGNTGETWLTPP